MPDQGVKLRTLGRSWAGLLVAFDLDLRTTIGIDDGNFLSRLEVRLLSQNVQFGTFFRRNTLYG